MRAQFVYTLMSVALFAIPASAGNIVPDNGRISWQSTQCTPPAQPPSLSTDPETRASDMNARVAEYNAFVQAVRGYVTCVSNEAQHDADVTSQAITGAAQTVIEDQQKTVTALGAPLRPKDSSAQ